MKKVYLLVGAIALGMQVNAQTTASNMERGPVDFSRSIADAQASRTGIVSGDREADDVIWENGFDDPTDWTIAGPAGDPIGWSIGETTNGWYFGTGDDMGTEGNFARFVNGDPTGDDTDTWGTPHEGGPFTLTYDGVINLTGVPAPHLEFEQYGARFITFQAVMVSTDGGTEWDTAYSNNDIDPLTADGGAIYPQPATVRFNLTSLIDADPSNVMIQFYWDGAQNGPSMNYVEYAWFVDNVRVVEGHSYDSDVQAGYFKSGVGVSFAAGMQYYKVPLTQLTEIQMSAETINQGGLTYEGLQLVTTVTKGADEVFSCTSDGSDVAPAALDSAFCTTAFTPADGVGTYDINWTFTAPEDDTFDGNNEVSDNFEVTEDIYSRANGESGGTITNFSSNGSLPFKIGNYMDIFNDGVIGGVNIRLGDDATNVGELIYSQVMRWSETEGDFVYVDQTADHVITAGENGGTVRLLFENPISVVEGDLLLIMAGHYGGNDVSFGMSQSVPDGVVGYDASDTRFGLANARAIDIQAIMKDFTGLEEAVANGFSIGQNQPNPFNGNSIINYELEEASNVSVEFVDVAGKVVKTINNGVQDAGTYTLEINGSDFAEGVYFYTFTVGADKVTKRMVVTK